MALNFGKLAFSVSFDPTSAFPIDARSYFESLADAQAAAASAQAAGSTDTVYYYGQTLVVVENDKAIFYIIQPDNTLAPVGGESAVEITVDTKQFEFDENGNLGLKGFDSTALGQILTIGNNGELTWTTPVDTYTKEEIDQKLAAAAHLNRVIVERVEDINEYLEKDDFNQYIFMVPNGLENNDDKYDEYIILETKDADGVSVKYVERVGSWEVNLDAYAKKADLNNYVEKVDGSRLITEEEVAQFAKGEENVIKGVSNDFTIDEETKILILNNLSSSKITDLQDLLNGKVDKQEGYTLLSPSDQEKLAKLTIDNGNLEISGQVNASQIIDLEQWLNDNAGKVKGLSENNLTDESLQKLQTLLFIKSVNPNQMEVSSEGQLNIVEIEISAIKDLQNILNNKADNQTITNLENYFNTEIENTNKKITVLEDRLVWNTLEQEENKE